MDLGICSKIMIIVMFTDLLEKILIGNRKKVSPIVKDSPCADGNSAFLKGNLKYNDFDLASKDYLYSLAIE